MLQADVPSANNNYIIIDIIIVQQQQPSQGRDDPNIHLQRRHTTAMDSSPTPWEEVNLANAWDISQTQLSRPTTYSHLIAWRPDGGGYQGLCTSAHEVGFWLIPFFFYVTSFAHIMFHELQSVLE